jgi:hypothetical protein
VCVRAYDRPLRDSTEREGQSGFAAGHHSMKPALPSLGRLIQASQFLWASVPSALRCS